MRVLLLIAAVLAFIPVHCARAQVQDQSDAVFSIVIPSASAKDVDMGRITVGTVKDSLLRGFVRNTGRAAIRLDSIFLEGNDAPVFDVTGGLPPVRLAQSAAHDVAFSFEPTRAGRFAATITLFTQVDTQRYAIRGEAVAPQIAVDAAMIDFGAVPVGSRRDSLVDVVLRNLTAGPVTVRGADLAGPDTTQFRIVAPGPPFVIPPLGTLAMTLRFAPRHAGRSSGSIAFTVDGVPDPAIALLFGEGIGVTAEAVISTDTLRAAAGEIIRIPIRLRDQARLQLSGATSLHTQLRYRASLLVPIGATPAGQLEGDARVIPLPALPLLPLYDDVIAEFDFLAVLGDEEHTVLQLEKSAAVGGEVLLREEAGHFTLTDICREGGTRLFDAGTRIGLQPNHPNPFNSETVIRFDVIERARATLRIRDMNGRVLSTLFDGEAAPGSYTVRFDAGDLPSGLYVYELRSGVHILRRVMSLLK